ncbi:unnamed protein product [Ectocarpus sp. 12 AP-2014]
MHLRVVERTRGEKKSLLRRVKKSRRFREGRKMTTAREQYLLAHSCQVGALTFGRTRAASKTTSKATERQHHMAAKRTGEIWTNPGSKDEGVRCNSSCGVHVVVIDNVLDTKRGGLVTAVQHYLSA